MVSEKETTPETLIRQILEKRPEIGKEQLQSRLSVARNMTGGLIADASLLRMIAAELGVEIPNGDGIFNHRLSLGHLVAGLNNATVTGRVVAVYPVKTFEGAKSGKLASVTIADKDGSVRVVLWNDKANFVESGDLKVGQIVKFIHGYTKADKLGMPELHVGERSHVELNPENVNQEDFPTISKLTTKINEVTLNQKTVNLEGTIKDVFSASTFIRSDQTEGKVQRVKVSDETGEVLVVFWNEKAEEAEAKLKRGAQIQIVNGKLKPNQNGELEVHVDMLTYVNVSDVFVEMAKIGSLTEDSGNVNVEGKVASLPVTREVKTSKGEMVKLASFDLQDETGSVRITAWREHSELASNLMIGEKVVLENVYAKMGYNGKVELSTRSTTVIRQT